MQEIHKLKFYKKIGNLITEIPTMEDGCWINIYPPFNQDRILELASELNIFPDFFIDSLDIDEKSRYDVDDHNKLIVVKSAIRNNGLNDDSSTYITIPIGIILHPSHIITISPYQNPVIDSIITNSVKRLDIDSPTKFVLHLFSRSIYHFLHYLKEINQKRNEIERNVFKSDFNHELKDLLDVQKSLVYFVTSLRSNELMMMKIQRTNFLNTQEIEETRDLMDDVIIDTSQALEMSNVYTNIMTSSAETYSSIISNNLNVVMKRLTTITIVLMIPTVIASFWGMNVKVPFESNLYAFFAIVCGSIIIAIGLTLWFRRKNLF